MGKVHELLRIAQSAWGSVAFDFWVSFISLRRVRAEECSERPGVPSQQGAQLEHPDKYIDPEKGKW